MDIKGILTILAANASDCHTSILHFNCGDDGQAMFDLLALVVNIFSYGIGAAAVIGVMIAGIQYITARENPNAVAKAKTRLFHITLGLIAWVFMWGILQFLLPGGLFANNSANQM